MLTPVELAALVTATKGSIEIFDKIAGQIRSVLERRPKEEAGTEDRWKYKVGSDHNNLVVTQDKRVIQTLTGDELASKLKTSEINRSLRTSLPACAMRIASTAISRRRSDNGLSPRVAVTDEVSNTRFPHLSTGAGRPMPRRIKAFARASNSSRSNGLVR